jgi:hypothetical protein
MNRLCGVLLIVPLAVLGGCASLKAYPERSGDTAAELTHLEQYHDPAILAKYEAEADAAKKRALRNDVVTARLRATDLHFNAFQQALFREGIATNIVTDLITLGLAGATATIGGATTKAALGAVSGGVIGAKASIDKNAYFEKTMPAILSQMIALRKTVLVKVQEGLTKDVGEYPLNQALIDLEDYYTAGTIPGAIVEIAEQAGAAAKKADALLLSTRTKGFFAKERQDRAERLIDRIKALPDAKAISLATNLPLQDPEIDSLILKVDPTGRRKVDGETAKRILIMSVPFSKKSDSDLDAWEAALKLAE